MTPLKPRPLSRRRAFTLLELLVVIAIIGILAAMYMGGVGKAFQWAKTKIHRVEKDHNDRTERALNEK